MSYGLIFALGVAAAVAIRLLAVQSGGENVLAWRITLSVLIILGLVAVALFVAGNILLHGG